jgi:Ca2+-binding EF-hand superfamily protein
VELRVRDPESPECARIGLPRGKEAAGAARKEAASGADLLQKLRDALSVKFGNLTRAWRKIDHNGDGKIDKAEVSEICKQVGVEKPLLIWRELDSEKKGYVTLADFAPDEHRMLTKFAQELTSLAITVEGLWPKIDPNMSGRVTRDEFLEFCRRCFAKSSFGGESAFTTEQARKALYSMLDDGKDGISIDELNFIAFTGEGDAVGTPETILGGREAVKYESGRTRSRRSIKKGLRNQRTFQG